VNKYIEASISYLLYAVGKPYVWYKRRRFPAREKTRILVVRVDALGDMVLTLPFLRELRVAYPDAEITIVCSQLVLDLVEKSPYVDEVLVCPVVRHAKHLFFHRLNECLTFVREVFRGRCFDLAFSPISVPNYINAWLNYFSGATRRIGNAESLQEKKHTKYMGSCDVFFTDHVHTLAHHEVEQTLACLELLHHSIHDTSLELWTDAKDRTGVMRLLKEADVVMKRKKIVVCMTTSAPTRNWPVENYISVCRQIEQKYDVEFFLLGAGDTATRAAKQFCAAMPEAHDFTNKTNLRETVAIMQLADFHLGGDTGTAHIAAACGLHGVELFASVRWEGHAMEDPSQWFAPWESPLQIIQPKHALPGCEHGCVAKEAHCIKLITVNEVVQAMEKAMERKDSMEDV